MKIIKKIKMVLVILMLIGLESCDDNKEQKTEPSMKTNNLEPITLINPFEVPKDKLEESIIYWEACRDFLKKQPGYISTKLHQSIKDDSRFVLVNVAEWESAKVFMEASQKMANELGVKPPEGLKANPSLYNVVRE